VENKKKKRAKQRLWRCADQESVSNQPAKDSTSAAFKSNYGRSLFIKSNAGSLLIAGSLLQAITCYVRSFSLILTSIDSNDHRIIACVNSKIIIMFGESSKNQKYLQNISGNLIVSPRLW